MLSLAFASILLLGNPADLEGQQAIDKVRQLIRSFGDSSELRIQGLSRYRPYGTMPEIWSIQLKGNRLSYSSNVDKKTGTVLFVSSGGGLHGLPNENGVKLADPEVSRRAQELLKASGERRPVGTPYTQLNPSGVVMYWYPLLVNGYRFFGGRYSVQFLFKGRSGTFIEYRAPSDPPRVNASKPKIGEKGALNRAKALMDLEWKSANRSGYQIVYLGPPRADLAYYVGENETTGRLAWRVIIPSEAQGPLGSRPWSGPYLIDAVTGEQIHFTVAPTP